MNTKAHNRKFRHYSIENVIDTYRNVFDSREVVGSDRKNTFESVFTEDSYQVIADVVKYKGIYCSPYFR